MAWVTVQSVPEEVVYPSMFSFLDVFDAEFPSDMFSSACMGAFCHIAPVPD
jgi:hypothetical protein